MAVQMRATVLDCPDPAALAAFYRDLLGWEIIYSDADWVTVSDGSPLRLSFQLAPDHTSPSWPDPTLPQQLHLDFGVDDPDEAERYALALGAVKTEAQPAGPDGTFRVYLDPAGHPFCLCSEFDTP